MNKKIAVPADENGILDGHFGHCRFFNIFEIIDNQITSQKNVVPPPHEPGVLPKWLAENGVTDVIANGMGEKAFKILTHFKINVHKGAPILESYKLVESLLNQTLELADISCNHNHEHGHEHNHEHIHLHNHKNTQTE